MQNQTTSRQQTFSLEQIKTAHAKVKSGADFPRYIRDIKLLGVLAYVTFVEDGHTEFRGENNYLLSSPPRYSSLQIAHATDSEKFIKNLKEHQQGLTGYNAFCNLAASCGIAKWIVSLIDMTCIYYDSLGNQVLIEEIPG